MENRTIPILATLCGCDDNTVVAMDVDTVQLSVLRELQEKARVASTYGCMPTVRIDRRVVCDECNGAKLEDDWDQCWKCDGRGFVGVDFEAA